MAMLLRDRSLERRIIARRRRLGLDRFDEVWDGVYIMSPLADDLHQRFATRLAAILTLGAGLPEESEVRAGTNISDREVDWKKNYRCPDVAVFLPDTKAVCKGAFWYGGPDFAVEVVSPRDRSRKKLPFYAQVRTRELLIVDRKPWALELYRLHEGRLDLVGRSTVEDPVTLRSEVVPLSFRLVAGEDRPHIELTRHDGREQWSL
jgi:Uma2 family endonuclease